MELIAPPSVHWEIGNAFSAMLKRKRVSPEEAFEALEIYGKIPIKLVDVELAHSLKIAAQQAIHAYDAHILRCAQKYRSPLVSLDRNLAGCANGMGIEVKEIS